MLVTGGAGFIGSHLCDRLLKRGDEVLCLDNFYTGAERNLYGLMRHPRFTLIRQDVCLPIDVEAEEIFNLASPASPIHYQNDPVYTTKTIVNGALSVLELAERLDAKILQASTSEIYGDPLLHPQTEDYWGNCNPIGPRSCYDEGKRCAETLFFDYRRQHGLKVKVARIFNCYGPRMQVNDGRVIPSFIVQALQNKDVTIHGDGCQTRSFCYVDDLVEGLVRLMETPDEVTGPINLGNPVEHTMVELAQMIIEITGSTSKLIHLAAVTDDPRRRKPNIGRARDLLAWQPHMSLREGLETTVEYFRTLEEIAEASHSHPPTADHANPANALRSDAKIF